MSNNTKYDKKYYKTIYTIMIKDYKNEDNKSNNLLKKEKQITVCILA